MYFFITGLILFFATHLYSSFRNRTPSMDIKERLGYMWFMGVYSIISGLGFVLIVWGFGLSRPSPQVFTPPSWSAYVTMAFMLPSFVLLFVAYGPQGYIKKAVKHPMLLSIILWAGGHLLTNGELNSLFLFGSFLLYAIINRIAVSGRPIPVKRVSIIGDIYAIVIGVAVYYLFIKYLHGMMIGVEIY
ncbi:MAG: NnrU family protein [Robiginitomaculum sp.]